MKIFEKIACKQAKSDTMVVSRPVSCPSGHQGLHVIQLDRVFKFYTASGQTKIVLDHVSAVFQTGRSYGLMGVNGAGKSTLLRLIAGTEIPNSGKVQRSVRVSWPLGFSGGFHPLMTGRENIKFVARAYGERIGRVLDFVEDFSELGDYIDAPYKTYSSGMMARLAFGLSMAIEFDCYLVDEITAVGDARFQARCKHAFDERRKNADLIIVSHSMQTIKDYCDHGAVLVDGQLMMFESVDRAIETYNRLNR
jgi:capsular polysaccharide transport system ATP-binding protein